MTVSLARRLTWEGVVAPEDANDALYRHVTERISFLQGLVERHPEMATRLEAELGNASDRAAASIDADAALLATLPPGLTVALAALPVRRDPETGVVHVFAAHPTDAHVGSELAFHLGSPVVVEGAPLTAILAVLAAPAARSQTPAFGTGAPKSDDRAPPLGRPSTVSPSERPIPLVRRSLESVPPSTARHGSLAPPAPLSRGPGDPSLVPIRPEPFIALTTTRPLGTPAPPVAEEPQPAPSRSAPPAASVESEQQALEDLAQATTPEEVVAALIQGLRAVAATVVVFTVRGKNFEGRDASDGRVREAVRGLIVPADPPSILQTAVQSMGYVGSVPNTPIHEGLASALGNPEGEVAAFAVMVSGRAALVYVAAGLATTYLATRHGDKLADAAGKALARIVRGRKK